MNEESTTNKKIDDPKQVERQQYAESDCGVRGECQDDCRERCTDPVCRDSNGHRDVCCRSLQSSRGTDEIQGQGREQAPGNCSNYSTISVDHSSSVSSSSREEGGSVTGGAEEEERRRTSSGPDPTRGNGDGTSVTPILCGPHADENNTGLSANADLPSGHCTFPVLQKKYREKVAKFFAKKENYDALTRIVLHRDGEEVFAVLLYFIVRHSKGKLYSTIRAADRGTDNWHVYSPFDQYNNALKKYQKRFYNLEDKVGSGDLVWDNIVNPRFLVAPQHGSISLPLAKLIGLYWVIDYGFDELLWRNYEGLKEKYKTFTEQTKRRYTENHKRKQKRVRAEVEAEIIDTREEEKKRKKREEEEAAAAAEEAAKNQEGEEGGNNEEKPRKRRRRRKLKLESKRRPTRFTRKERKFIAERIRELNLKKLAIAREQRANKKKQRRKTPKYGHRVAMVIPEAPPVTLME